MRRFFAILRRIAIVLLLCGAACVLMLLTVTATILYHFNGDAVLPADCAIVFGAAVYANDRPGPAIVRRVATASNLYKEGKIRRLFLSGGRGGDMTGASEASVMREQAIEHGVKSSDIVLEESSRSTWDNIMYTRPLTSECQTVIGLSDRYHLARIELIAWRQGWSLDTYSSEGTAVPGFEYYSIAREVAAYVYYLFHLDAVISVEDIKS